MKQFYCDECGSRIIQQSGRYICSNCGLEQGAVFEASSYQLGMIQQEGSRKKQQFAAIDNQLATVSSLGSSIGTIKEYLFKDVHGAVLSPAKQEKFRKFKTFYHIAGAVKGKETDHRSLKIMNDVCSLLNIPEGVNNRAIFLYKKYKKEFPNNISNHVLLSTMALILAVRESRSTCPVQFKEIIETYRELGHRVSGKNIISLMQDLNIKMSVSGIRRSEEYVSRICSLICSEPEIKERVERKYSIDIYVYEKILQLVCYRILERIPKHKRGGRRPYPFAASAAYVTDKLFARMLNTSSALTQKLVARAANVAEFTVRDHAELIFGFNYEDIFEELSKKISSNLL